MWASITVSMSSGALSSVSSTVNSGMPQRPYDQSVVSPCVTYQSAPSVDQNPGSGTFAA